MPIPDNKGGGGLVVFALFCCRSIGARTLCTPSEVFSTSAQFIRDKDRHYLFADGLPKQMMIPPPLPIPGGGVT